MTDTEIFDVLTQKSPYHLDGLKLLRVVKKKCKCNTDDVLRSQLKFSVKKIGDCFSHSTIYDYGITHENIRQSRLEETKK